MRRPAPFRSSSATRGRSRRPGSAAPSDRAPSDAGDQPQVLEQNPVEARLLRLVLAAQHGGWMERGDRLVRPARRREATAVLHEPEAGAEDRVRRRRAEAYQDARPDQGQLGLEPWPASGELAHARRLVDPTLALLDELEVLHGVRDVHPHAVETDFG